jgi:hypothetical protein
VAARQLRVLLAAGLLVVGFNGPTNALAQPQTVAPTTVTPSVSVDPDQPGATPHWTITLAAAYCGGYRVGDGVYLAPEPPLVMPTSLPPGSVLFAGQTASLDRVGAALRVGPGSGLAQSMICTPGSRALTVDVLPAAGFSLPADPGQYTLEAWTGADQAPISLSIDVASSASTAEADADTDTDTVTDGP